MNGKKAIGLDWQNNITLQMHHASLYISFTSLHDYDMKMPNFTFCKDVNTRQGFSFPERRYSLLKFNSRKKIANIWQIEHDGISAIKFEAVTLYFLSDVFVAVVVVA